MLPWITNIIKDYQDRVRELPYVPTTYFRWDSLGYPGDVNKLFLTFLFSDRNINIQFLKDVGLIRSKVQCNSCGRDMTWYADPSNLDGFRWRCHRMVVGTGCYGSRYIRHRSWFHGSNLTLHKVLYLTYDILRRKPANLIQREHHFSDHIITDWGMFAAMCKAQGESHFTQFLAITASTDWSSCTPPVTSRSNATWLTAVHPRKAVASRYSGMRVQSSVAGLLTPCFSSSPQDTHIIALTRMSVPLTTIFGSRFSSHSQTHINKTLLPVAVWFIIYASPT